jgi:hypothetical protein
MRKGGGIHQFKQQDYAVGRSYLTMYGDGGGRTGIFTSPHGYARVFVSAKSTFIIFIHAGRTYSRSWDSAWGDKTAARLARELIDQVVG